MCGGLFEDPATLPCGHLLCRRCLGALLAYHRQPAADVPMQRSPLASFDDLRVGFEVEYTEHGDTVRGTVSQIRRGQMTLQDPSGWFNIVLKGELTFKR
jgi:hypothetical protein